MVLFELGFFCFLLDFLFESQAVISLFWRAKPSDYKVTGLVVFRNESSSLPGLISSIQSLDLGPEKWVFVDDGSSDGGAELVREAGFVCLKNSGEGKNEGFTTALSQLAHFWVWLVDADVVLGKESLLYLKKQAKGADVVLGPVPVLGHWVVRFENAVVALQSWFWANSGCAYTGCGRNMLVKREYFQSILGANNAAFGFDDALVLGTAKVKKLTSPNLSKSVVTTEGLASFIAQKKRHRAGGIQQTPKLISILISLFLSTQFMGYLFFFNLLLSGYTEIEPIYLVIGTAYVATKVISRMRIGKGYKVGLFLWVFEPLVWLFWFVLGFLASENLNRWKR